MLAADYPFLDLFWTMLIFFFWIMWIWLLFTVFGDIFRRHDISGWAKTAWIVFAIVLPFLGVFIYLITQNVGMTERNLERSRAQREQFDDYVRADGGGRRRGRRDREGQAAVRLGRDHAGRVRGDQAEGAGVERHRGGATKEEIGPALPTSSGGHHLPDRRRVRGKGGRGEVVGFDLSGC